LAIDNEQPSARRAAPPHRPGAGSMDYCATTIPYAQSSMPTPGVMPGRRRGPGSRSVPGWPRRVW
jgi:hypothetical protein